MQEDKPTLLVTTSGDGDKMLSNEQMGLQADSVRELRTHEGWIVLAFLLLVFTAAKLAMVEYSFSDENVYFYMGKLVSEGLLPYRDFRFAHPPLKLIPPAVIFALDGFNFLALKLVPVLFTNISAIFIYCIVRRTVSHIAGVFAAAAFLFSFAGLYYSSYYMGTNMTVALLCAAFYLYTLRRDFPAGMVFGAALLTGIYAACALAAIGLYLILTDRERLKPVTAGFLLVVVPRT